MQHRLTDPNRVAEYVLGGKGTATIRSEATGKRFTYKFGVPKNPQPNRKIPIFVKLLVAPETYQYIGCIWREANGRLSYAHGANCRIGKDAPSIKAIQWFLKCIERSVVPDQLSVYHEGVCGRCGRKLTVPESIESGLGPVCARLAA